MKNNSALYFPLLWLALLCFAPGLSAQQVDATRQALNYLRDHASQWKLSPEDLQDLQVSHSYQSEHNGVNHVYFAQTHAGIEIFNAISGLHLKDGKVVYVAARFLSDVAARVNALKPALKPEKALLRAAEDLGIPQKKRNIKVLDAKKDHSAEFAPGTLSRSTIPSYLMYYPMPSGRLRLCWVLGIEDARSADHWLTFVDAHTGAVLDKVNQTISCTFPGHNHSTQLISSECLEEAGLQRQLLLKRNEALEEAAAALPPVVDGASYNVFAIPVESPLHGQRRIVSNPADPNASPFGWHDTNGSPGPEYTTTRGNNTNTYLDLNADNRPDTIVVPNGGANLTFNYAFNGITQQPSRSRAAAITQLFYMNNIMHDFTYQYGFNEVAGNFQQNNYGKGGRPNDAVNAEAQDGTDVNNANFATGVDGNPPRMQMFIWTPSAGNAFVDLPAGIAGKYPIRAASFGRRLSTTPVTADIAVGLDGTTSANLGCQTLLNPASLRGKIVLIDRGSCTFERKALNAQNAGAIACVVCNFENNLPAGLADDPAISGVTIPVVGMRSGDCDLMRQALDRERVQLTLVAPPITGPDSVDASFDNGIIAHEYGHGISTRLTGGPGTTSCLVNDEQMGEGWSDFFALVTTVVPGQSGSLSRGVGNYVLNEGLDGTGIRRAPYSTSARINNQVYDDIIGTAAPHPVGEVWSAMLWDLYWALVDKYGWDADLYRGKGGNNIAIRLVMDGMKLQNCSPGFIDGRDAILAADALNNAGANECLIWEVFAKRGLGWSADQGSTSNRNDGFQAFDTRPECIKTLKVEKIVDAEISAGDTVNVSLLVYNHKNTAVTAAILNDELPNGLSLIPTSVAGANRTSVSNGVASFELGTLAAGGSKIVRYKALSNRNRPSIRQAFDDVEGTSMWQKSALEGQDTFRISTDSPYEGVKSWKIPGGRTSVDQALFLKQPIRVRGQQPVLKFQQNYDIEAALDAGILEVSTNGGASWQYIPDSLVFRNGYTRPVTYITFSVPRLRGFSGTTDWYEPTYVNLRPYLGRDIQLRFRFGSNDDPAVGQIRTDAWYIDNIEFMDLVNYNGQACLSTAEGDKVCAQAPSRGTLVESGALSTSTRDLQSNIRMSIFPNPTGNQINVQLEGLPAGRAEAILLSAEGRMLQSQAMQNRSAENRLLNFDLSDLPAGMYLLQVKGEGVNRVEKVVKY